jgi:hypothetical protein
MPVDWQTPLDQGTRQNAGAGRPLELMHTRPEPFAFVRAPVAKICGRNNEWSACSPQLAITARGLQVGMTPCGEIALNPYKQDIFPHRRVIKSALVSYIIDAMKER